MAKGNGSRDRATKWIRSIARIWSLPLMGGALLVLVGIAWSWLTTNVADPYAVEDYPPTEALAPIFVFLSVLGLGIAGVGNDWEGRLSLFSNWQRFWCSVFIVRSLAIFPVWRFLIFSR